MQQLTVDGIRGSFVNATDRELELLELPMETLVVDWFHLDFLAWRDPSTPARCMRDFVRRVRDSG